MYFKFIPIWLVIVLFSIFGCGYRTPPGVALYQVPPPKPMLSSSQRENLTETDIMNLIDKADEAYDNNQFSLAKDIYYEVLLAMPEPSVYVLVSYGSTLANLRYCENAIEIFNVALEKDSDNEVAKENIGLCRQVIAAQTEEQHQFELAQQRQQQENFENLISSLNSLSASVANLQNKNNRGNSAYFSEGAGLNEPGGATSDCASYQRRYKDMEAKRNKEALGNAGREGTADGKNAVHRIKTRYGGDPDISGGATSGDYRVINSSKKLIREYDRQLQSIERQARKDGCSVY